MFATWPQAVLSIFSPTFPFLSFRFLFCSFLFYSTIAKTINLGRLEGSISPTNKLFFFFFLGGGLNDIVISNNRYFASRSSVPKNDERNSVGDVLWT